MYMIDIKLQSNFNFLNIIFDHIILNLLYSLTIS